MKNTALLTTALVLAAALSVRPAAAAPAEKDPVAGPLEVFVMSGGTTSPGGLTGIDVAVVNNSTNLAFVTRPRVFVTFADGRQIEIEPFPEGSFELGAGCGFVVPATVILPPDAAPGLAFATITAHPSHVWVDESSPCLGGGEEEGVAATPSSDAGPARGHSSFAPDNSALDQDTFLVLPG